MKSLLIAVFLLIGCAHGSKVEIEELPPIEVEVKVPSTKPEPAEESTELEINCHVKIYSENGCTVYEFSCENLPTHSEVVCTPPPVWPWEMPPDPVYGN